MTAFDPLEHDAVRIRWLSVDSAGPDLMSRWTELLDEEERRRAGGFHFDEDRRAFIAARALTRSMLSAATGWPTDFWRYSIGEFGKPRLAPERDAGGLRFNISHTRRLVVCAIAFEDVGVDAECLDRATDLSLANSIFAPEERRFLNSAAPEATRCRFFRIWTLKEAFIKATGEGLSRPLDSFSFAFEPLRIELQPGRSRLPHADDPADWQFAEYCPTPRSRLALATRRNVARPARLDVRAARLEEIRSHPAPILGWNG
jgi:4'-phosphopantetheinyl transferase